MSTGAARCEMYMNYYEASPTIRARSSDDYLLSEQHPIGGGAALHQSDEQAEISRAGI